MAPPITVARKIATGSTPKSSRTKVKRSHSLNVASDTRNNAGSSKKKNMSCSCEAINEIGRVNTGEWRSFDEAPFITLPSPGESVDEQQGKNQTNKSQRTGCAESDVTSASFTGSVKWVEGLDVTTSDVRGTHSTDSCNSNPSAEERRFNVGTETDCSGNLSSEATWSYGNGVRVEKQNKLFCPERNIREGSEGPGIERVKVRTQNTSSTYIGYTKGSILSKSRNGSTLCTINEENDSSIRNDNAATKSNPDPRVTQPVLLRCKMTLSSDLPNQRWSIAGSGVQDSPNLKGMHDVVSNSTRTNIPQAAASHHLLIYEDKNDSNNEQKSATETNSGSKDSLTSINVLDESQSLQDLSHDRSQSLLDLSQCMSPGDKWESPNIRLGKTMSMNRPKESKPVGLRRSASFNFSFRGSSEKLVLSLSVPYTNSHSVYRVMCKLDTCNE